MWRNSAAGELLPEVPTALKQKVVFCTVTMLFWQCIFCPLSLEQFPRRPIWNSLNWEGILVMKAGILKLAGETTKAFKRLIVINGLFLQTQLCMDHWCEASS